MSANDTIEIAVPILTNSPEAVKAIQALSDHCTEFAASVGTVEAAEAMLCIALTMLRLNRTPVLVVGDIVDRQVERAFPGFLDAVSNDFFQLEEATPEGEEH